MKEVLTMCDLCGTDITNKTIHLVDWDGIKEEYCYNCFKAIIKTTNRSYNGTIKAVQSRLLEMGG